jgi:hypothetical protein
MTLDEFGVHLDEMTQRTIGMENNRFLSGRVGFDKVEEHKFFGPIWESISYLVEQVVFNEPLRVKLLLRRAMLWAFFVFGLWRLYMMGLRNSGWGLERLTGLSSSVNSDLLAGTQQSRLRWGAMLPVLMVALWPRMFAEAHYNTKDALFFVLVLLVVDGLDRVWRREKQRWDWGWFGVMGLLGVATTVRMGGVFVLGWAMLWPMFGGLKEQRNIDWDLVRWLIWGGVAFLVGYIGSYPYLWFTGFTGLKEVIGFAFSNPWPNGALFFGSMEPSRWYLLGWMVTTLSGLILVPLFLGVFVVMYRWISAKSRIAVSASTHYFLLVLLLSYVVFVMIKMPVMYDAWRHSLFLLLPVVVLSARAWMFIYEQLAQKGKVLQIWVFLTLCALISGVVGVFSPGLFSFFTQEEDIAQQKTEIYLGSTQTHFNDLGSKLIERYPMQIDYWHQTNYQALQWIANQMPADASALLIGKGESLQLNAMLLPKSLQQRVHCVTPEFLETEFSLDSMNALWPLVNKRLKYGQDRFLPIKKVFWVDFGDHLQETEKLGHTAINQVYRLPLLGPLKSWQLTQSFYRESLPLVRVYEGELIRGVSAVGAVDNAGPSNN